MSYEVTKNRVLQWTGIILVMAVFAGAYWYFQVFAGYKTNVSPTGSITSGLVGYWTFDGADTTSTTATDRGSGGNNGTLTNGPTVIQGKVGQALNFASVSSQNVTLGDVTALKNSVFTWSAWVNPTTYAGSERGIIGGSSNIARFSVAADGTLTLVQTGVATIASTTATVPLNTWSYVAITYDALGNYIFYIDGVNVKSGTNLVTFSFSGANFTIGSVSSNNFNGGIDEVRAYNRVLSASEIQSLYKLGQSDEVNSGASQAQGGSRLDSGLAGYWKMDDGSGTSATDSSTNGNTGTLTNGPTWGTGQIGGAVSFDNVNDEIALGDVVEPDTITLSAWINRSGNGTVSIINKGNLLSSEQYSLFLDYASYGTVEFLVRAAGGGFDHCRTSSAGYATGQWYHVTGTYNGVTCRVYVNGIDKTETVVSDTTSGAINGGASSLTIGSAFNGLIDEARIYNRSLSSDEVTQLYRLTTPTGVDTGLKGYWSFNGKDISGTSVYDRSGVGTIGTLTNSPLVTPGIIGQALSFDGVNDYVQLASNTALDIDDNFTISAWVRPESFATLAGIVGKYHAVSGDYFLRFNGASPYNKIEFGGSTSITSNTALTTGQWYHIVAERSSGTGYIYINGVLDTSGSVSIGSSASNDVTIGLDYLPSPRYFKGKIDEVRIYNRVLSGGEIKSLYASGQSDEVNTGASQAQGTGRLDSGLAGYWKLDDGSGTSATDASTNGNTGTLTNGPTWGTGQIGGDVVFDGSNDYISYANNIAFDSADFTIASWFRLSADAGGADGDATFFSQRTDVANDAEPAVVFYVRNSNDKLNAVIRDNAGAAIVSTGATTISQSQWYHGTMVKTSTRLTLYLNGVQDASTSHTLSGDFDAGATHRYIGKNRYSGADNGLLNGALDEVRVYNRALSADEIAQLYRLTTPTGVDTGLKGYWSFNGKDLSGTTAYDRSGSGNNGTLTNGPTVTPGKAGQALMFDGTDDFLTISDTDDSKYTGSLTLCTWAKIDTGGAYRHFMGKHSSSGAAQNPFDFRTDNAATPKLTLVRANTTNIGWEGPSVTLGQWKHYCVVAPALIQSAPTFYIDGVATTGTIASGSGTGAATGSGAPIVMGLRPDNAVIMDGAMDEVRIYNRELTSNEIVALYNSGR